MYNRKKRLFLTAVCLSLGLLTGCNVGDTKNYKQAAQNLEQGNYEELMQKKGVFYQLASRQMA